MSTTTLDHPDPDGESTDPKRSALVAQALTACYDLVSSGRYADASRWLRTFQHMRKSPQQELRVLYMRATTALRQQVMPYAIALLSEGLDRAEQFDDMGAIAQFAYMYATTVRELGQYYNAARHAELAVTAWRDHIGPEPDAADTKFELDALILLNQLYFFSGKFTRAEQVFRAALRIAQRKSVTPLRRANLAWIEALNERWRSRPGAALDSGMSALTVLDQVGKPLEQARLRTLLADIAMDQAERGDLPLRGGISDHFLSIAERYAVEAFPVLRSEGDPFALGLGQLMNARLARLTNRNLDRHQMIEAVARVSWQLGDRTVLGQTWIARGDEYLWQGEWGQAATCFQIALDSLKSAQLQAYSVMATRGLRKARRSDD